MQTKRVVSDKSKLSLSIFVTIFNIVFVFTIIEPELD